ncbi:MAG: DciA family protein [Pseudomonadota bacterium]
MINKNSTPGIADRTPKRHGINKISVMTKALLKPLIDRYGAAYVQVLLDWANIVGPRFAELSHVIHLKFPANKKTEGVLQIRCISAAIPLLQAQSPQIIDRINRYFGYNAVAQLRFQAGLVIKKLPGKAIVQKPLPPETQTKIESITSGVSNDTLREALQRLGAGIYQEEELNRAKKG